MMKRLLLTILALSASAWAGTCGDNYNYGPIKLTLQKASGSDQTNFPYPIVSAYAPASLVTAMKTAANGGQIQNTAANSISVTGPADLVFCDAASAGNALKYETAMWSATTGAFEFWVQIPTLHTASNDSIYLFANNSAVSTTQQDLSLWSDAGYVSVYHMPNGTTLSAKDSLAANDGTINGATATTGQIDGGSAYVGASSQYIDLGASSSFNFNLTGVTIEAWANPATTSGTIIVSKKTGGSVAAGWVLYTTTNQFVFTVVSSTNVNGSSQTSALVPSGTWSYLVGTSTTSPTSSANLRTYLNGAFNNGGTNSYAAADIGTNALNVNIGRAPSGTMSYFTGSIDELRFANVVKDANWIATNYNVQSGASTPYLTSAAPSTANIVQQAVCWSAAISTPVGCTLPFPVTSGDTLVWSTEAYNGANGDCAAIGSHFADTLSTSYTMMDRVTSLGNAEQCLLFGVAPSTGANTVTYTPSAGTGGPVIWVAELDGMSSPATDATNTASQSGANSSIPTGSATATTSNSFYVCTAGNTNGSLITAGTPGTFIQIPIVLTVSGSSNTAGFTYAFTGSGANSCTFTTVSGSSARAQSGLIGILKYSLTTSTVRHRVVRH